MQVVRDGGTPLEEVLQERARQFEGQRHPVAIVVVRNVLAPVRQTEVGGERQIQLAVLLIEIDVVIATIDFPDGDDHGDHVLADLLYLIAFIDGESVEHLDHRFGAAGFRRMQRAAEQIDRLAPLHQVSAIGGGQSARIGELLQDCLVVVEMRDGVFIGDDAGNDLAAFLGFADGDDFHPLRRRLDRTKVLRRLGAVCQSTDGAGHIAKHFQRRRHRRR